MKNNALIALINVILDDKIEDLVTSMPQGKRGPRGLKGDSFDFNSNKDEIKNIISNAIEEKKEELKLKFDQLTPEEKDSLKLKYEDLSDAELYSLRGPRGQKGKPGESVRFEDIKDNIYQKISDLFFNNKEDLKLKFSDLTEEEKNSLKLKFSNLTDCEKEELKGGKGERGLRGERGHDGQDGKDGIDGKDGERGEKGEQGERGERGPRGQKGKKGDVGDKGDKGDIGPRGAIGPKGLNGQIGPQGPQGIPGKDAAEIIEIDVAQRDNSFELVFYFNDGTLIRTNSIILPDAKKIVNSYMAIVGGGSGGGGLSSVVIQDDGVEVGEADTINFGENLDVTVTDGVATVDGKDPCLKVYDESNEVTSCAKSFNFIGNLVEVVSSTKISDWNTLSEVDAIGTYEVANPGNVDVIINQPYLSNNVLTNVSCLSDVYVGSAVVMTAGSVAVNGLADNLSTSNVIGIVEAKSTTTLCDIRVLGVSGSLFVGLDLSKTYYLSDTIPGAIVDAFPSPGNFKVKIGKPFNTTNLLVQVGEVEEIGI